MIDEDSLAELKTVSNLISTGSWSLFKHKGMMDIVSPIILDAIEEAIKSSNDVENAILYILKTHSPLTPYLKQVVEGKFPAYQDRLEKLIVLT